MKLRSLLALALVLCGTPPALAQVNPGTTPLSIAKGGTGGATASAARTNLGLAIGSNVEAWNTNLDCLAALASNGVLQRTGAGTCAALTNTSLTALINLATASLSGALPAWPGTVTTYFRGDGTYVTLNPAALSGLGTGVAAALGNNLNAAAGLVGFSGALGTPTSGTLTNATGLPISTGVSGLGTGVAAALGNTLNATSGLVGFSGALGTPTSGTLTNATGLPISTGLSGAGTGVLAALAVNVGSAGAFVTFNGALGTPSSGTLTNATGLPYAGIASAAIATCAQLAAATASTLVVAANVYCAETTTTFGATTTFDFSSFINTAVTLTGNITTMTFSAAPKAGQAGTITFIQDATGSRTTVWNSILKFTGGATPTLTTTANAVDVLTYSCRSASFCVAALIKDVR